MRYLPKSPADRKEMLDAIGVASIDELFTSIPEEYRLTRDLKIPLQQSEDEILGRFKAYAAGLASGDAAELAAAPAAKLFASFLGAGAYRHYRPVVIDALVQRGEFLTSYTPYQPEIAQGTLQARSSSRR
jgi:glycine dehydrogenase subunit 1